MESMLCPSCRSPLEEAGLERLETTEEHVCNPNGTPSFKMAYRCSDGACITRRTNIVWNDGGERYGGNNWDTGERAEDKDFIDGNDSPFGTLSRKLNVEINRKGLPRNKTLFIIGNIKFLLEFHYRSDTNGKVLKKRFTVEKWRRERGSWYHYEFPIVLYFHDIMDGISRGRKAVKRKDARRKEGKTYEMNGFEKMCFSLPEWEKRWWRVCGVRTNRLLFPSLAKDISFRH